MAAKRHGCLLTICIVIIVITLFACIAVLAGSDSDTTSQSSKNMIQTVQPLSVQTTEPAQTQGQQATNEKTILDRDGLKITFLGFSEAPKPAIGYYINLRIDNMSEKDYTIQIEDVSVGNMMVPFGSYIFSPEILAGKSLNDHIWICNTENLGITEIKSAEFSFLLFSDRDFDQQIKCDSIVVE